MRLKATRKCYPLHQSPLYRIRGQGQFEKRLEVQWGAIDKLISPDNYRVWLNNKGRQIQHPFGWLAHVHGHIGKLLARIELPDYLYSQKGRSYADNAKQHVGTSPLIKTDIHKFYPSTTWQMVYRLFTFDFECAADIARRLADICCYQQEHLPTGSPLSGYVAFFAAKPMFDEIANLAASAQCKMTVYVDDVTVSGQGATKELLWEIRKVIHRHGFITKLEKSRSYAPTSAKTVTGAIIVGHDLRLPNKRHHKIMEARQAIAKAPHGEKLHILRTLRGRLQEARQLLGKRDCRQAMTRRQCRTQTSSASSAVRPCVCWK